MAKAEEVPARIDDGRRQLRAVDSVGEVYDDCPGCLERDRTYGVLEGKYRGALSQIGQLRADKDAEARADDKWPVALGLFRYWQVQTGHDLAEFTTDRFEVVRPFLVRAAKAGRDGPAECRSAIRGLVASDFHMKRGADANRKGPKYDEFSRPFSTQDEFETWRSNDPSKDVEPSISQRTLIEHAKEVAGRVLERAALIESEEDPVAVAQLLVEIDELNHEWRSTPFRSDKEEE